MKYTEVLIKAAKMERAVPRLIRKGAAGLYLCAPELLMQMETAGWVEACVKKNRMTLYDIRDLDGCIERLRAGEYPGEES